MADVAIGVDLPVGASLGQLLAKRDDLLGRDHRVVPAVEGDDLGLDLLRRQARRVEQAVEADRGGEILAGAGEVERALAAKAVAGGDDLVVEHLVHAAYQLQHVEQAPAERGTVAAQAGHLAKAGVARSAAELLAKQVGDEAIVTKLHQLAAEADLEVGDAHDCRDQQDGRARLPVAPADEDTLQALVLECVRDCPILAHACSLASSASLATVFMLRAVPDARVPNRSFERPCPEGKWT